MVNPYSITAIPMIKQVIKYAPKGVKIAASAIVPGTTDLDIYHVTRQLATILVRNELPVTTNVQMHKILGLA
jgi:hypothetical protein